MSRPVSLPVRLATWTTDTLAVALLMTFSIRLMDRYPAPDWTWIPLIAACIVLYAIAPKILLGRTPAQIVWKLETAGKPGTGLREPSRLEAGTWVSGIFLAVSFAVALPLSVHSLILSHPIWIPARVESLDPFFPQSEENSGIDWEVQPYYYTLGAWPRTYEGQPIFHLVPYEKGPPSRFLGHIQARWKAPQIQLTFEGPKTPKAPIPSRQLQRCLQSPFSLECVSIRREALGRHIDELRPLGMNAWELSWIEVINPAIPFDEQVRGILITAWNLDRGQDRFILLTPKGAQQLFVLDYPQNESGRSARETFLKALRTLRVSDELAPGRAWVQSHIQSIDLRKATTAGEIANAQSALLAHLSVDPKSFEGYYHLGGTALLLGRAGAQLPKDSREADEWLTLARKLTHSAWQYAEDVAPADPRTAQLKEFWQEAQKL